MVNDDWLLKFLVTAHVPSWFTHLRQEGDTEICCDCFNFFLLDGSDVFKNEVNIIV
jgi:hypothetical protein